MDTDYDYIIVGSGFGGSVSALRLSEKGYKVLVVEKGKWYGKEDFAKSNWDIKRWLWIPFLRCFGIMKISFFKQINVLSGVGVGGGSLVYANTLPIPKTAFFESGSWANLEDWESTLKPYYQTALKMLGADRNPQLFDADKALLAVAKEIGKEAEFSPSNVSVYFGKPNETVEDPYFGGQGPERTGCNFCGACMIGCPNDSKNTLDKNYLYLAQINGAEIVAENEVFDVKAVSEGGSEGYEVHIRNTTRYFKKKQKIRTKGVIFSAGVLGTIKLLLKLKESSLPSLSKRIGYDVRSNNETLVSVASQKKEINMSKGVAIGSILHTDENSHLEVCRYPEGSNAWKLLHTPYSPNENPLIRWLQSLWSFLKSPLTYLQMFYGKNWAKKSIVLLFMQTIDTTIQFKRGLFGGLTSSLSTGKKPTPFIPESVELTNKYAAKIDGKAASFVGETLIGIPSTAHILGGAVMANSAEDGVIDKENKVFGYQNMYIIDGSMISSNPGVNPSLSITAIAEHAMSKILPKDLSQDMS